MSLKDVKKNLSDEYWMAKRKYIKYYEKLPIYEKSILLEIQHAKQHNGNVFYIAKYLSTNEKYQEYKVYLACWGRDKDKLMNFLELHQLCNINIVIYSSDEYVRLLASAKYIVTDITFWPYYIKKEGQIYLNTWHGTPLKMLGNKDHSSYLSMGNVQKNLVAADYLLFPNEFTKNVFLEDYMLKNIARGKTVIGGYPRNEVFFDNEKNKAIKEEQEISDKRIYAYMPTFRGSWLNVGNKKSDIYMLYYLFELDKLLNENEILYVNLHPIAKKNIRFEDFTHIKEFPENYETYEFLNCADCLITDYSSVMFDFACTHKKIILFAFDKEYYLEDRGTYMPFESLPFSQVTNEKDLIKECRTSKLYDDTEFLKKFCSYDGIGATQKLCDYIILGEDTGLIVEDIPNNGKENVLLYAGNLAGNGITASLRNLLDNIDTTKRNYYISYCHKKANPYKEQLHTFDKNVNYFGIAESDIFTVSDKIKKRLFNKGLISAKIYMRTMKKRFWQEFLRAYGGAKFNKAIQFGGYENEIILMYSAFNGNKAIFVHNDMLQEIKTKHNQRKDILKYAYNDYDKVVTVSKDIIPPTKKISGTDNNIVIVKNIINYKNILEKSVLPIDVEKIKKCSVDFEQFMEIISDSSKKFISIGRFSPEKGHDQLVDAFARINEECPDTKLIIMGGVSNFGYYDKLKEKVENMNLQNNVVLLLGVENPYPILKACDYFILSSHYEGMGIVLFEANVLGKPMVSTDVTGPRGFMKEYGGTLVEDSVYGVYEGLKMLLENKVSVLNIDYEKYNQECVKQFEELLLYMGGGYKYLVFVLLLFVIMYVAYKERQR